VPVSMSGASSTKSQSMQYYPSAASRRRRGPVALRPRLSPSVRSQPDVFVGDIYEDACTATRYTVGQASQSAAILGEITAFCGHSSLREPCQSETCSNALASRHQARRPTRGSPPGLGERELACSRSRAPRRRAETPNSRGAPGASRPWHRSSCRRKPNGAPQPHILSRSLWIQRVTCAGCAAGRSEMSRMRVGSWHRSLHTPT
jgi:hypothetical protein